MTRASRKGPTSVLYWWEHPPQGEKGPLPAVAWETAEAGLPQMFWLMNQRSGFVSLERKVRKPFLWSVRPLTHQEPAQPSAWARPSVSSFGLWAPFCRADRRQGHSLGLSQNVHLSH